jgi:hypothetical protein
MRIAKLAIALCLFLGVSLSASGPVGVFALIENVVFEPNGTTAANAERVQVWGAFSWMAGGINAVASPTARQYGVERGYLYFALPKGTPAEIQLARNEWADLKSVAGTGQAVGFGEWYAYPQNSTPDGARRVAIRVPYQPGYQVYVQKQLPPAVDPAFYITNVGVVKIAANGSHAELVKKLRDALAAK